MSQLSLGRVLHKDNDLTRRDLRPIPWRSSGRGVAALQPSLRSCNPQNPFLQSKKAAKFSTNLAAKTLRNRTPS